MNHFFIGILLIVFNAIGYIAAFYYFKNNEIKKAVMLLMLCGLSLRVFCSHDVFLHAWDERYHALAAKHLLSNWHIPTLYTKPVLPYNPADWMTNYYWVHKPPLPIYSIALSYKLFGVNVYALRLPSIVLTTLGILLMYKLGSFFKNKKVGFIAAFLFSINGLIIELTSGRVATDHVDIFFLFFILLSVVLTYNFIHTRKTIYNILVGVSLGCAILSKWLPAFIVLPIWSLLVWHSGKYSFKHMLLQLLIIIGISCIIFIPWQLYIYNNFPLEATAEAEHNVRHIFEVLGEKCTGPWYYFINQIRINYGELIYLPIFYFIYKAIQPKLQWHYIAIFTWFIVPFLFFSYAVTKMQAYLLFTAPALFVITAIFYEDVKAYTFKSKNKYIQPILLVLLLALPARYCLERVKPFSINTSAVWTQDLKDLYKITDTNTVLFNCKKPIDAMFFTNIAAAYYSTPSQKEVDSITANNYKVIVNNLDTTLLKNCKSVVLEDGPAE